MKSAAADQLVVVRLDKTNWRISDADGELLGYVERQRADRFEIVWMSDPLRWGYADSFDEAIAGFGDSVRFTGETSERRENSGDAVAPLLPPRAARRGTWVKKGRSSVA